MKAGNIIGALGALVGISLGIYFSVSPVAEALLAKSISGHQIGTYFASIGAIIGLSCGAIGMVLNRATHNT